MVQWQPLALLYLPATIASLWSARVMLRRRRATPAAGALTVVMLGVAWWSTATAVGSLSDQRNVQLAFSTAIFPGVSAVVAGYFCHSLAMVDRSWRLSRRTRGLLLIEPVLVVALSASNAGHHQFFRDATLVGDPALLMLQPGPLFWLHTMYSYGLLACAILLVLHAWVHAPAAYRRQFMWPLVSAVPPIGGNLLGMFFLPKNQTTDLTPIFFLATAAVCWWALTHQALPDLVPVTHQQVLATLHDGVLEVSRSGRIVDLNPAAELLLRRIVTDLPDNPRGQPLPAAVARLGFEPDRDTQVEITDVLDSGIDLDVRITSLYDQHGTCIGWVLVAREITEHNRRRAVLRDANAKLTHQLATIESLRAELAEQAVRDELTGLHNRRHLLGTLARWPADRQSSLLILDIDHFKRVNDTYGHRAGDQAIRAVAGILAGAIRGDEIAARYGGEEFVVVLPDTDPARAVARAEEIRARCAATPVPTDAGPLTVTISLGVAAGRNGDAEYVLEAADQALYRAKQSGRNRVEESAMTATHRTPA
ncbi:histidine kinase N-terminal 7TM domain-containing diguanylate cyclase [Paractinoplanes rishiriensis]|uniref:GGDEF domain-containing protein n=1 Tax=Paractinoplanes rishiriensis TaxID=1050105 RepID=A0A919K1Q7_9ACTN|nr:diguanylate cyclase [Actinoplanes rishiriensis]GIE97622.1 GGDEF domain-containing protein [Actinoplanes rishiriensis]